MHRLERKSQLPRVGDQLALKLREEMEAGGFTAKEVSRLVGERTPYTLDYRAVQNAMAGTCSVDTVGVLAAAFGWSFLDDIMEPVIGATRLAALEREYEEQRAAMVALDQSLKAHRAALHARATVVGGRLRLVPPEDRSWPPSDRIRDPQMGAPASRRDR